MGCPALILAIAELGSMGLVMAPPPRVGASGAILFPTKESQMVAALATVLPAGTTIVLPGIVVLILVILLLLWIF
jgi:uridine phosphorylase